MAAASDGDDRPRRRPRSTNSLNVIDCGLSAASVMIAINSPCSERWLRSARFVRVGTTFSGAFLIERLTGMSGSKMEAKRNQENLNVDHTSVNMWFMLALFKRSEPFVQLLIPSLTQLDAYADALRRGWSPDNVRLQEAAREELEWIADDRAAFVALLDDPEAKRGPITLPDASQVRRLPGYRRWMWDGDFCCSIAIASQPLN